MSFFFCKNWEYSKPSKGPTLTAGVIPRGRDGARQDGTASRGPVESKSPLGLPDLIGTTGPYKPGLSNYSETHVTTTV